MPKGVAALGGGFAQSWGRNRTEHPRNAYERPLVLYQLENLTWLILARSLPDSPPVVLCATSQWECNGALGVAVVKSAGRTSALVGSASPPCSHPEYKREKLVTPRIRSLDTVGIARKT
jgi:hypothetical protein